MASLMKAISEDKEQKTKEQLKLLLSAATGKLKTFELELDEMFRNPAAMQGVQILGTRAFEQYKMYSINVSNDTSKLKGQINDVLTKFFPSTRGADKGEIRDGIIGLIEIGLDALFGNAMGGEMEENMFFIIPDKLNLIRVDVKAWRYNFEMQDVVTNVQNAFCYIFTKSIVDHSKLSPDELLYFISRLSNGNFDDAVMLIDNIKVLVKELMEIYNLLKEMDPEKLAGQQQQYLLQRPSYAKRIYEAGTYTEPAPQFIARPLTVMEMSTDNDIIGTKLSIAWGQANLRYHWNQVTGMNLNVTGGTIVVVAHGDNNEIGNADPGTIDINATTFLALIQSNMAPHLMPRAVYISACAKTIAGFAAAVKIAAEQNGIWHQTRIFGHWDPVDGPVPPPNDTRWVEIF